MKVSLDATCINTHSQQTEGAPQPPILALLQPDMNVYPAVAMPAITLPVSWPPAWSWSGKQPAHLHLAWILYSFGSTRCTWLEESLAVLLMQSALASPPPAVMWHLSLVFTSLSVIPSSKDHLHRWDALKAGAGAYIAGLAFRALLSLRRTCYTYHHLITPTAMNTLPNMQHTLQVRPLQT